ncbi:MAG: hypothetical protein KTR17_10570, partial [Cellvibrionaceae bacterium]|nr:hypothetical protein [Cellvibrionaceae bacterium]
VAYSKYTMANNAPRLPQCLWVELPQHVKEAQPGHPCLVLRNFQYSTFNTQLSIFNFQFLVCNIQLSTCNIGFSLLNK